MLTSSDSCGEPKIRLPWGFHVNSDLVALYKASDELYRSKLSPEAKRRLQWITYYERTGNVIGTCRYFGISRKTFYTWLKRYDRENLRTLEERSHAPRKPRQREITRIQEERVVTLKKAHIRYGKLKIAVLYETAHGEKLSSWKVQKVIEKHKLYYQPVKQYRTNRKRARSLKRKRITELKVQPLTGFLLCVDTIVLYWNETKRYIFTAIDRHAKVAFARMYPTKSSVNGRDFLLRLHYLLSGKIQNVGHDNGSEFRGFFSETCRELDIEQYVSRVKTPKDNATNERFNRTLEEEFIQMGNRVLDLNEFNRR